MKFESEASKEFYLSLSSVDTLVQFAKNEEKKNNTDNRTLFLKLSIVLMVTRFQVYIENILKEFKNRLIEMNLLMEKVPKFMKLNSLRLITSNYILHEKLTNREAYDSQKYEQIHENVNILQRHFKKGNIDNSFEIDTSFPLGKTGSNELISLFKQINGMNIFDNDEIDINTLDGILLKRHLVIHLDRDPGLTDLEVLNYQHYLREMCKYIDGYLNKVLNEIIAN